MDAARRRALSALLTVAVGMGLLAACGETSSPDATPTARVPTRSEHADDAGSPPTTAAPATTVAGEEDFDAILRDLLARRDEAYEKNDVSILESIYSPQCACLANGRAVIEERGREGVHVQGERLRLLRAEVASRVAADLVFVRGIVSQGPNNLVDSRGAVVRPGNTQGPTAYIYELRKDRAGWVVLGITKEGEVSQ